MIFVAITMVVFTITAWNASKTWEWNLPPKQEEQD